MKAVTEEASKTVFSIYKNRTLKAEKASFPVLRYCSLTILMQMVPPICRNTDYIRSKNVAGQFNKTFFIATNLAA